MIQERVRATYNQLPFHHLPRIMVKYLVIEATKKLNFFPNKYSVLQHYSPSMILHQETLDYNHHCKFTFGECVQAHDDTAIKNNNAPCTLDCIYLQPSGNAQGEHKLFHLQTNAVTTCAWCTAIPITISVINQVLT
jgi:hypothetical protein